MKNQREEEEEEDMISQLPQPLLHHILCYLSIKEAVQTCVLSKSWRHLVSTRPDVQFCEWWFTGENNKETFLSFVDTTLQRYQDQKLSVEDFWLQMSEVDSESTRLLEKWVPLVMLNMGVKTFGLSIHSKTSLAPPYFDLPSEIFRAQLPLQNLYLERCKLMMSQINFGNVVFKHLETLQLVDVYIEDETFEKIMSCCPSIEDVSLEVCEGLKTIKVADKLKRFEFKDVYRDDCDIEIDVLTIEKISILGCPNWFHNHCHKKFVHLKDLRLGRMHLSTESFGTFSHNFPFLEDLTLSSCYGFKEIKLSSCSIKLLTITDPEKSMKKVTIHAPNIRYFQYGSDFLPSSFSFTTASGHGWKSDLYLEIGIMDYSAWFFKLNKVLRALSQSEISLDISIKHYNDIEDTKKGALIECVAVEQLVLRGPEYDNIPRSSFSSFLTWLFRVCRPRNIYTQLIEATEKEDEQLTKFLCEILLQKRKGRDYCYFSQPDDVVEVRVGLSELKGEEWRHFEESSFFSNKPKTIFRLKWKELS